MPILKLSTSSKGIAKTLQTKLKDYIFYKCLDKRKQIIKLILTNYCTTVAKAKLIYMNTKKNIRILDYKV